MAVRWFVISSTALAVLVAVLFKWVRKLRGKRALQILQRRLAFIQESNRLYFTVGFKNVVWTNRHRFILKEEVALLASSIFENLQFIAQFCNSRIQCLVNRRWCGEYWYAIVQLLLSTLICGTPEAFSTRREDGHSYRLSRPTLSVRLVTTRPYQSLCSNWKMKHCLIIGRVYGLRQAQGYESWRFLN